MKVKGQICGINHSHMFFNFTLKVGVKSLLLEAPIMFAEGFGSPRLFHLSFGFD